MWFLRAIRRATPRNLVERRWASPFVASNRRYSVASGRLQCQRLHCLPCSLVQNSSTYSRTLCSKAADSFDNNQNAVLTTGQVDSKDLGSLEPPPPEDSTAPVVKSKKKSRSQIRPSTYPMTPSIEIVLELFPNKLARSLKSPDGIYILHNEMIDYMMEYIGSDILRDDLLIVEPNAGPGIFTQRLLDAGAKNLRIIEDKKIFIPKLESIAKVTADRLSLVEADFFNMSALAYIDKISLSSNVDKIFGGAPNKLWNDESPILVIGISTPRKERQFWPYLPVALSEFTGIFSHGRVEFLCFISEDMYGILTATPTTGKRRYRSYSVLCQLYFDIELLRKEQRCNFYPPQQRITKQLENLESDEEQLFLVRMRPKRDLMTLLPSPKQLSELAFFVRQHMTNQERYIISTIENWIPKSGPRLIRMGYTIFMRFGDLTPLQYLELFREFSSWPEYNECSFHHALFRTLHEYDDDSD